MTMQCIDLDATAFIKFSYIGVSEFLCTSMVATHTYDLIYSTHDGNIIKVRIAADTLKDAINCFCNRYNLVYNTKKAIGRVGSSAVYDIKTVLRSNNIQPYYKAVIAKIR